MTVEQVPKHVAEEFDDVADLMDRYAKLTVHDLMVRCRSAEAEREHARLDRDVGAKAAADGYAHAQRRVAAWAEEHDATLAVLSPAVGRSLPLLARAEAVVAKVETLKRAIRLLLGEDPARPTTTMLHTVHGERVCLTPHEFAEAFARDAIASPETE